MVRRRALPHAPQHQLDFHSDRDLALVNVGHLAEEAAASFEIDHRHYHRLERRLIEVVFREGEKTAAACEGPLEESFPIAAARTNTRDRKLHGAAARAIGAVQPQILSRFAVPE